MKCAAFSRVIVAAEQQLPRCYRPGARRMTSRSSEPRLVNGKDRAGAMRERERERRCCGKTPSKKRTTRKIDFTPFGKERRVTAPFCSSKVTGSRGKTHPPSAKRECTAHFCFRLFQGHTASESLAAAVAAGIPAACSSPQNRHARKLEIKCRPPQFPP